MAEVRHLLVGARKGNHGMGYPYEKEKGEQ